MKIVYVPMLMAMGYGLEAQTTVAVNTDNLSLIFKTNDQNKLMQSYFGEVLSEADAANVQIGELEAYPAFGTSYTNEGAIRVKHENGSLTTNLVFDSFEKQSLDSNVEQTTIHLKDSYYKLNVDLFFKAYQEDDIIEQWVVISNQEKKAITLYEFASSHLAFDESAYWLTSFTGNWASEMNMQENQLSEGIKIIDSKLGARANLYEHSCFLIGLGASAQEESGVVIGGTLAWPGSFKLAFEVDQVKNLHILAGANSYASEYTLEPKEAFKTPALLYTLSTSGTGTISRNFHSWARKYGIHKGDRPRMTLLNNWEATYFDFNEDILKQIIGDAGEMGFDLFLLDDGWFGNKYPRDSDKAGLGDWEVNKRKLPNGVQALVDKSKEEGVKFGIWIEPEMVNPKSELYEKHPEWVLTDPNREFDLFRNQLILDLSNPKVQDHVFGVVDDLMTANPEIAYLKWDCNRYISNAYSQYLPQEKQSHLWIEYVKGLMAVLDRVRSRYPDVYIMLCSGGGGRIDYGSMPYFDEYWISDNTDALDRIFIQWGATQFFPALGLASHVSVVPNHITQRVTPLKFRFDVAMSAKLGMDLQPKDMTDKEKTFSKNAIQEYNAFKDIVQFGDQYRLLSPYENDRAALMYSLPDGKEALVFSYHLKKAIYGNKQVLYLRGLDPEKTYRLSEVNKDPEKYSWFSDLEGKEFSGDYLMKYGVRYPMYNEFESVVFKLTAL